MPLNHAQSASSQADKSKTHTLQGDMTPAEWKMYLEMLRLEDGLAYLAKLNKRAVQLKYVNFVTLVALLVVVLLT